MQTGCRSYPQACSEMCTTAEVPSNTGHFALAGGVHCFCRKPDTVDRQLGTCKEPCSGDASLICGGIGSYDLYAYDTVEERPGDVHDDGVLTGYPTVFWLVLVVVACGLLAGAWGFYRWWSRQQSYERNLPGRRSGGRGKKRRSTRGR